MTTFSPEELEFHKKEKIGVKTDLPIKVEIPKDSVLKRLVPPHSKKSRLVTIEDIDRVIEDSKVLYELCFTSNGFYKGAFAMHHSQIDDKDPLSFFVTAEKNIVINPSILRHSSYLKDSREACMTFGDKPMVMVQRWQKIVVEYYSVVLDDEKRFDNDSDKDYFKLSNKIEEDLSGFQSLVWQHEIDHGNALYIYQY